jgi:SsrA-binding protein
LFTNSGDTRKFDSPRRVGEQVKSVPRANAPTIGNPKARWRYEIIERVECGIALLGPEVKSLREGRASIEEAYARFKGTELWLVGMHIDEYRSKGYAKHEPRRPRKLLLNRTEIAHLRLEVERRGFTLVPLRVHWGDRGWAKVDLALVKGRKLHDKREADREKTAKRDMARAMRRR